MRKTTPKDLIDATKISLTEWLELINIEQKDRSFLIMDYQFPTSQHLKEYVDNIDGYSELEVKELIFNFIVPSGTMGCDDFTSRWIFESEKFNIPELINNESFLKRLIIGDKENPPWQSISWILDLLPNKPYMAIDVIRAFFNAHIQYMPDGRIYGYEDIITLIRAKFINHSLPTKSQIHNIRPYEFEFLCAYLYEKKGYKVKVTRKSRDGGYDVLAEKETAREYEILYIECKQYEGNVGVRIARNALGLLNIKNATKSVIITSSDFTKDALNVAKESKRLELINLNDFDKDMRKYVDTNWAYRIDNYILHIQKNVS
ncbi:restriction endonuclease [Dryocola clanedunensis]|uniref:restriction endonuclease n=1 Tax=Cedecea sulfonylureivorans TaxID=3051154 RepID=UPI0019283FBA|nr:restriction endonuclease [Cedecea sulfonylureivorans]